MTAVEIKHLRRRSSGGGDTGDSIGAFRMEFISAQISRVAMDAENLREIREIGVADQIGARPNATGFDAAVSFGDISVLRGEKSPVPGRR